VGTHPVTLCVTHRRSGANGIPTQSVGTMKKAAASQEAIAKAIQAIRMKVNRSWIRPMSMKPGLKCRIRVRLMSDGTVIEAEVIASSGDEIFDRSAENAVNKASPLPVPQDKDVFTKNFRSFTFTFDPDRGAY
jgi:colicin import membrane protein